MNNFSMMRHAASGLVLISILSACSGATDVADAPIYLWCEGDAIDYQTGVRTPSDGKGYIYRVFPNNEFQIGLHAYVQSEEKWVTPCLEVFTNCVLNKTADEFVEIGETVLNDGKVYDRRIKTINRRTGSYTEAVEVAFDDGKKVTFEGTCRATDAPLQAAAKF